MIPTGINRRCSITHPGNLLSQLDARFETVYRYGGEEFIIIVKAANVKKHVVQVSEFAS